MKNLTAILLILSPFLGISQIKHSSQRNSYDQQPMAVDSNLINGTTKSHAVKTPSLPIYIIDSVKVMTSALNYFDPNEIANLSILKNAQYPDGAVCITLKDHSLFLKLFQSPLLSLNDISKTNIPRSKHHHPVLYIVDNRLLIDTAAVRIPSVCITKVTVVNAKETPYFKTALPNALLIFISITPLSGKTPADRIMIRGTASNN